ncbi:NAD-dependent deacylase [Desulfovibrio sp. X2]|uniref:NAD-dependent deacylase n=1 Tax=Desulfovibrio sp. X2 TaxID=941449 RepID=UPI001F165A5E|nr:NAD-dependent deacylase [Desulfovibrio sp. X2]
MESLLARAAKALRGARHAVAFTGAGISVPSGIPDFRSPGGLWSRFDPEEVASIGALRARPRRVWEFLIEAMDFFGRAAPNSAHLALARLEEEGRLAAVITQNIDGLHQAAGSRRVIEFHGGCEHFHCMSCAATYPAAGARRLTREDIPWRCAECGGVIRPDVVFFGEGIPPRAVDETSHHASKADLVIVVGTSGEVAPANQIPLRIKAKGGTVIEINLGPTLYRDVTDIRFDAPAEDILPRLASMVCC